MSNRVNGILKIELKSDMCVGSGYSFAGIIDSDICYDDCGIPYIPAKRIKGCIRETLETMLYALYPDGTESLFGIRGDNKSGDLRIDNAYIDNYDRIHSLIKAKKNNSPQLYETQGILGRFSHVVAQTAMKDGVVLPQTLRYTRVVNKTSPISDGNLKFEAAVSCSKENWEILEKAVKGTKHIGLKRNRGMGNVKCEVVKTDLNISQNDDLIFIEDIGNDTSVISYSIKNVAPLMLSSKNEMESESYIPGRGVLGALAGKYLSMEGKTSDDKEFKDLFLNGLVVYTNLYISDGKNVYYQVPDYINKLKKSGKIINLLGKAGKLEPEYKPDNGNQPKKIKNTYMTYIGDKISFKEVDKDIVYHNSHRGKKSAGDVGLLYSMNVVSPGQIFSGAIILPNKYIDLMKKLLCENELYFGKSKSAEYGKCVLVTYNTADKNTTSSIDYKSGESIVVTFLTDTALVGKTVNGYGYVTEYFSVVDALKRELGIEDKVDISVGEVKASLRSTLISGYMSVWNLQRETIPAIEAGSYIVLTLCDDVTIDKKFIGEYTSEGYGQISISKVQEMQYVVNQYDNENSVTNNVECDQTTAEQMVEMMSPIIIKRWLDSKINEMLCDKKYESIKASNSSVGRFTLMLRECEANNESPKDKLASFQERINSIKRDNVRHEGEKLCKYVEEVFIGLNEDNQDPLNELIKDKECVLNELKNLIYDKHNVNEEDTNKKDANKEMLELINEKWTEYLMTILTNRKYEGGEK